MHFRTWAYRIGSLAALTASVGCQADTGDREPPPPADQAIVTTLPRPDSIDSGHLIRPDGIGVATAGMTVGELRKALPAGTTLGPATSFMVDFTGIPVLRGTDTLYYALVAAGPPVGEDSPIPSVATRNPASHTAEGVGPGATLGEAVAIYGAATLSYNTNDESREFATFQAYPHPEVHFRIDPGPAANGLAGRYSTRGEYNETSDYDRSARISVVSVNLESKVAGSPLLPAPWSQAHLRANQVPAAFVAQWKQAENRDSCAILAPASLGDTQDAKPRPATFAGGWAVAYDFPQLRSAFGIAGTGVRAIEPSYPDFPLHRAWADSSTADYGPEGGTGPNQLAYLRVQGQSCLYNVWSRLGRSHLEFLLSQLRLVDAGS